MDLFKQIERLSVESADLLWVGDRTLQFDGNAHRIARP